MEGDTMMSFLLYLSTRCVAQTFTALRAAGLAARLAALSGVFAASAICVLVLVNVRATADGVGCRDVRQQKGAPCGRSHPFVAIRMLKSQHTQPLTPFHFNVLFPMSADTRRYALRR